MPARHLLVVEDDEKSRRLLVDVLRYHGYRVEAFASGEEGVAEAARQAPHAALLDIQLPGIDGFETLARMRTARAFPVMAVTASVMAEDRARILAAGFDACLAKPVNIGLLLRTVEALLGEDAK